MRMRMMMSMMMMMMMMMIMIPSWWAPMSAVPASLDITDVQVSRL